MENKLKFRDTLLGLAITGYCDIKEIFLENIKNDNYIESLNFSQLAISSFRNTSNFDGSVKLAKYLLNTELSPLIMRILEDHLVHNYTIFSMVKMLVNDGVLESNYNASINLKEVYILKK